MALKAWYKLNGNTYNYGMGELVDLTQVTAPTWADGKLSAQAMAQGAYSWTAERAASILNNDAFTYAAWIYVNASGANGILFGNDSERIFALYQYPTRNDLHFSWRITSGGGVASGVLTGVLPDNKWTHIAAVYKKGSAKFYVNGIAQASSPITMSWSSFSMVTNVFHNSSNRRLQDVRIYDEALSPKEVYDLSRGLMLHYTMEDIQCPPGNANLFTAWGSEYTKNAPYTKSVTAQDGYFYMGDATLVTVTPGTTYYLSLCSDAIPGAHGGVSDLSKCDLFTAWFYMRKQGTSTAVGGYDSAICFSRDNIYINNQEARIYVWKWTAPSDARDITLRLNMYSNGSTSITHTFWNFKLETGGYSGYTPASSFPSYSALGYNSTVVRDCSGYGHDATAYTSVTKNQVSPRHLSSATFADGNCLRNIVDPIRSTTTEFTISVWFTTTRTSGYQCIWNGRSTMGAAVAIFLDGNAVRVDDSAITTFTSATVSTNTWYHLVLTWKSGGNKTVYLNGTARDTVSAGTLSKTNTYATIARSSDGDGSTPSSSNYFYGSMSDFRIYSTELSAADVKCLYNSPDSIDNLGGLSTEGTISEGTVVSPAFSSTSVHGQFLSEILGRYNSAVRIEPDGSAWVKIIHHADPTTYKFASTDPFSTGVYTDYRRWFAGHLCTNVNKWEFMAIVKPDATYLPKKYRWVQSVDPNVGTYANVAAANVTKYGYSQGYDNISSEYGGIYKYNANSYYVTNNSHEGNWWGAFGAWNAHQGGIPGFNALIVKDGGYQDLYLRVDNVTFSNSNIDSMYLDKGGQGIFSYKLREK